MSTTFWDVVNWYWSAFNTNKESIIQKKKKSTPKARSVKTKSWKCTFCNPKVEFSDYFEYSAHFFNKHIQPELQKLCKAKANP